MGKVKVDGVEFSQESHKFRKFLSIICFLILLGGYSFLFIYNIYTSSATSQLRVVPQEFSSDIDDVEQKITLSGNVLIDNDHWNSINIKNFKLTISMFTENKTTKIDALKLTTDIPNHKNTTLKLSLELNLNESLAESINPEDLGDIGDISDISDIDDLNPEDYEDLKDNLLQSQKLIFVFNVSFDYGLYSISANVEIPYELEVDV